MRPLAVLIGIVTGSTVSVAVGLTLTWLVLLFLPEQAERFAAEQGPLLRAMALFTALAGVAGTSFYAELRLRPWRVTAHAAMLALLSIAVWAYWPKG